MDSNNIAKDIQNVMQAANSLVSNLKNHGGFNLTDEEKKEWDEKFKQSGINEKLESLKKSQDELRNVHKKFNAAYGNFNKVRQ